MLKMRFYNNLVKNWSFYSIITTKILIVKQKISIMLKAYSLVVNKNN